MREMGIVGWKKALLLITLSLKTSPKEYHHSGNLAFCLVPLISFRYQNQYVNEWESLESAALSWVWRLQIRELSESWHSVCKVLCLVSEFCELTFDKKAPEPVNYYYYCCLSGLGERFNLVNNCLNYAFSQQQGQICWKFLLWHKKIVFF